MASNKKQRASAAGAALLSPQMRHLTSQTANESCPLSSPRRVTTRQSDLSNTTCMCPLRLRARSVLPQHKYDLQVTLGNFLPHHARSQLIVHSPIKTGFLSMTSIHCQGISDSARNVAPELYNVAMFETRQMNDVLQLLVCSYNKYCRSFSYCHKTSFPANFPESPVQCV